jgi:hypothetical protein
MEIGITPSPTSKEALMAIIPDFLRRLIQPFARAFRSGNRITFRFAERSGITDYNIIWQPSLLVMDVGS